MSNEQPHRRSFKAAEKAAIVSEYDEAATPEARAAIMRQHGVYASLISKWRHRIAGTSAPKRGRPPEMNTEVERLRRENERLRKRAERAEDMVETLGKVHALLQNAVSTSATDTQRSREP